MEYGVGGRVRGKIGLVAERFVRDMERSLYKFVGVKFYIIVKRWFVEVSEVLYKNNKAILRSKRSFIKYRSCSRNK